MGIKHPLCGVLFLAAALPSFGDNFVEPCTLAPFTVSKAAPTAVVNMVCQQFDPALGQLTDYGFISNGFGVAPGNTATFTLQNNGSLPPSGVFLFAFDIDIQGFLPGGGLIDMRLLDGVIPSTDPAPGAATTFNNEPQWLPILSGGNPQTASLNSYIGTGTFTIPMTITVRNITNNNFSDPLIALTDFSATVTSAPYLSMIYDPPSVPTPEPASSGFLLIGIAASAFVLNRRQTAAKR